MKKLLKVIWSFLIAPTSDIGPDGASIRKYAKKYPNGMGGPL